MTEPDERDSSDVRALLDTALHGEPPTTFDVARLTRLGKRRLRVHRTSAALGVMVLAGGIVLATGLLRHGTTGSASNQISAAATSTPAPPSTISVIPAAPATSIALAADVVATQNAVLKQEFDAQHNGLYAVSGALRFVAAKPSGQLGAGYVGSGLKTRLGDKTGTGDFVLSAGMTIGDDPSTMMSCTATKMTCAIQTIDGISVEVQTDHPTATTTRIFTVALSLSGNVLINGTVDNLDSLNTRTMTRPTPPLTADQLARITAAIANVSP